MWLTRATLAIWLLSRAALVLWVGFFDAEDGITELTEGWVRELRAGDSPFHEEGVAYPPLAMFAFLVPDLVGGDYAYAFAGAMLAFDAAGARRGGLPYVLGVAAMGPVLLLWRYDLAPAVCHLLAAAALLAGHRRAAWLWLGVGIALKPYLLVVVPFWWLADPDARRAALAAAPSGLAALAMTAIIGLEWVDVYGFQAQRGLSVEATAAILFSPGEVQLDRACLCFVRTPSGPWETVSSLAGLALLAALVWRARGRDVDAQVALSAAAVLAVIVTAPVISPQYLVWPLPVLALLPARTPLVLAAGAAVTALLAYPPLYDELLSDDPAVRAMLVVRVLALGAAAAFASRLPARCATPRSSSSCPPATPR